MKIDPKVAERLLALCSRLPGFPADEALAERETRLTLQVFQQRRQEVEAEMNSGTSQAQDLALLRCEFEALRAATHVMTALWKRKFGTELSPA